MSGQTVVEWHYHPSQVLVRQSKARFKVLRCGRRWRKTGLGWMELYRRALLRKGIYWWVAPRYKELMGVRQVIVETTPDSMFRKKTEVSMAGNTVLRYCLLPNGSEVFFHSADTEDSMRGMGLCGVVIDETDLMARSRWENELRPSLMGQEKGESKQGWAMFLGTPKGHKMLYDFGLRGQKRRDDPNWVDEFPEWESWNFSSYDNPNLDPRELDDMKRTLPDLVFRQEILAECLDDVGQVFRGIREHVRDLPLAARPGERYVVGCDLAKSVDFTVLVALSEDGEVRGFDRFQQLDWVFQRSRISAFCRRYNNARLLLDSTGLGDPIYDELRRGGLNVDGYRFTNASKCDLVENLSIMLDDNRIWYPDIPELVGELSLFGYDLGKTGGKTYGAPEGEGYHDDCVISLSLAAWQIKTGVPGESVTVSTGKRPR